MSKTNLLLLFLLLLVGPLAADPEELIVPGSGFGKYHFKLSEDELRAMLSPEDLAEDDQGDLQLFFRQPERRISVSLTRTGNVRAMVIHGSRSVWHTAEGITLGSTLSEVEKANGGPFEFSTFQGEINGKVVDWEGGEMARIIVVFASPFRSAGYASLSDEEKLTLEQPGFLFSSHPLAKKLNPVVETIRLEF